MILKSVLKSKKMIILATIIILLLASIITGAIVSSLANPQKLQQKLVLGEKYLSEMKYEEAIHIFKEVIEIEPRNVQAYLGISEAYMALDEPQEAINWLETGISRIEERREIINKCEELYIKASQIHQSMDNDDLAEKVLVRGYDFTNLDFFLEFLEELRESIEFSLFSKVVDIENDKETAEEEIVMDISDETDEITLEKHLLVETSMPSGTYNLTQSIELRSNGTRIYYTTDDSDPNGYSEIYKDKIILNNGENIIKAVAEDGKGNFGAVKRFSYFIEEENVELVNKVESKLDIKDEEVATEIVLDRTDDVIIVNEMKAYSQFMKDKIYKGDFDYEYSKYNFTLIDLDQNGIKELLVIVETEPGWMCVAIYHYHDKEVKLVDAIDFYSSLFYNGDEQTLVHTPARDASIIMTKFTNGYLKTVRSISNSYYCIDENGDPIYHYSIYDGDDNKTSITKEQYDGYYNKYVKDAEIIEYFEDTKKNRSLYIR